ncbi:MAG TPA: exopolysaccharide biosynthesis protein [Phenylobacterium sp.]
MPETSEIQLPLSEVLTEIAASDVERISVGELMATFGGRAFGAMLFVFGLACLLPWPPGGTTIFGLPLVLLSPQLIIGARLPWLPNAVKKRTISIADLRKGLPKLIPTLQKAEAISKPRLVFLFGPVGERAIGLLCLVLALILILPIPGGNIPPALAVSTLSFALIQRDGLIALLGYAMVAASGVVLAAFAHIIVRTFEHFLTVFAAA